MEKRNIGAILRACGAAVVVLGLIFALIGLAPLLTGGGAISGAAAMMILPAAIVAVVQGLLLLGVAQALDLLGRIAENTAPAGTKR